jgi:hypothetical protein
VVGAAFGEFEAVDAAAGTVASRLTANMQAGHLSHTAAPPDIIGRARIRFRGRAGQGTDVPVGRTVLESKVARFI